MLGRRQEINLQINQLVDFALLVIGLWMAHWLRADLALRIWPQLDSVPPFADFFWLVAVIGPFMPIVLEALGYYENPLNKPFVRSLRQMISAGVRIGLVVGLCEIFLKWEVKSRAVVVLGACLGAVFLLIKEMVARILLRRRLASGHIARERVLLAGRPADMDALLKKTIYDQRAEIEVVGRYDVANEPISRLVELLHERSASRVIFAVRHVHFSKIEEAVQACELEGVESWLSADFFQTALARPSFDIMGGKLMLVFHTAPKVSWALLLKECVDRLGALIMLLLSCPIWIVAAIGIKLSSPGPIFFTQDRAGRHGRAFQMYKFRTMCVDAEDIQKDLEKDNEMSGPVFKLKSDPRVFPFGKWLRRLSVDELPQLLNVLSGEMSLVGPRPLPVYEIERIEKHAQRRRLSVKPGLTCLWQVMGRNRISSFEEWVALDLKYIDNWSLWLDVQILCKTLPAILKGSGAH